MAPFRETRWHDADKAAIVSEIRRRKAARESLSCKKILRPKSGRAFLKRAKILFGRWSSAVIAAGFEPYGGANSPWPHANRGEVVAEIQRRDRAGKTLIAKRIDEEKWGQALTRRARNLFGSWSDAMRAAGLRPSKQARTCWADASKDAIEVWIRRHQRNGGSLRLAGVRRVKHGRALLYRCDKLFGSWNAALRAAGAKPARENSHWPRANKTAVLREIRRRKRFGKSLLAKRVERDKWGSPFVRRANVLFGSWRNALLAAGIYDWLVTASDYRAGLRRKRVLHGNRLAKRNR